jgi:hypothetical protein
MLTALAQLPSGLQGTPESSDPTPRLGLLQQRAENSLRHAKLAADPRAGFREAGYLYSDMLSEGACHPALFVNCGNAYLLAEDLPEAILAYRTGLRRYPLDRDLWENLELARDQVGYPGGGTHHRPQGDIWPPFLPRATPNTVLFLGLGLHAVAWIAATAWLMTRQRKLALARTALFASAALMGIWWGYLQIRMANENSNALVVVGVNGVTLRRGNGSLYPPHPDLPRVNRGMEARLLNTRGNWVQVQFPGGEIGWLPNEMVLLNLPRNWGRLDEGQYKKLMEGTKHR